jgi:hypothetical protein
MYRIVVSDSVTKIVHVGDAVASDLEILPILAPERMREILAAELEKQGFSRKGDAAAREEQGGVIVSVDLASGRVSARVATEEEVVMAGERATVAEKPEDEGAAQQAKEKLRAQLEGKVERREAELQAEATRRLEARLRDLREEMDAVVTRVTIAALKERAGQLGEIEEIHEDAATGELTIRVKV